VAVPVHHLDPAGIVTSAAPTFTTATTHDVPAVVALVESAYRGDASRAGWTTEADLLDGQRTDAEAVRAIAASPSSQLLLARDDDGELVACCQLERRDGDVCYFGMFAVRPGRQGSGLGRAVVTEAERRARQDWSASTMEMTVIAQRRDLIAWYVRLGYAETTETVPFPYGNERFGLPLRDDLYFVVLRKPLA
jgi:ribosomal protein S18 acetylase RimI-like enzyme